MISAEHVSHLSVEEYLESEKHAPVKREYVAGQVFAMVGVSIRHNLIAVNLATALRTHLEGGRCRVLVADVKVRVEVYRRESGDEWWHETHEAGGRFTLRSIDCTLEVDALYRDVSS